MKRKLSATTLIVATLATGSAFAHPGMLPHIHGFGAGFAHPVSGLEHLLAMTGLGLWAAGFSARLRIALPAGFVLGMSAGLALASVALPGVEIGVATSVVAIGALIALGARLPAFAAFGIAFTTALFHGHAHGSELDGAGAFAGILLATALLHAIGLGIGLAAAHPRARRFVRATGAAIAIAGVGLLAAA